MVGDLAVTELEQTFFNPSADTVEGLYTLTVPRGAVLQRFAVERRGTMVDATVQERASAAAQYQAQVYAGSPYDPALLEWDAPGRYHARLFPIVAGSARRILVIEQNHGAQLFRYLRAWYDFPVSPQSYHRPGPLPLRPGELLTALLDWRNAQ